MTSCISTDTFFKFMNFYLVIRNQLIIYLFKLHFCLYFDQSVNNSHCSKRFKAEKMSTAFKFTWLLYPCQSTELRPQIRFRKWLPFVYSIGITAFRPYNEEVNEENSPLKLKRTSLTSLLPQEKCIKFSFHILFIKVLILYPLKFKLDWNKTKGDRIKNFKGCLSKLSLHYYQRKTLLNDNYKVNFV